METLKPLSQGQRIAGPVGVAALVVGTILLLWGLAPAKHFGAVGPAFGGQPTEAETDAITEGIDAAMAGLGDRLWATGLGFVMVLGGVLAAKEGFTKREKSVEELVNERLEQAGVGGPDPLAGLEDAVADAPGRSPAPPEASVGEARADPSQRALPGQAGAAPVRAGSPCPTCGAPLVAGGRFCRTCGRV